MRRYKLSYFFVQALKGLWRNGVMTLASVTVLLSCLLVMGCFSMLVINIDHNLKSLGDLNEIVCFVESEVTYPAGTAVTLPPALQAGGKTSLGWSADPDADRAAYLPGSTYRVKAEDAVNDRITLYAVWADKAPYESITLRYDLSGVTVYGTVPAPAGVTAGSEVLLPEDVTPRGSTNEFLGWSTRPGSLSPELAPGASYTVSTGDMRGGVITLYAVWSEMPAYTAYGILYDAGGADVKELPTDAGIRLEQVRKKLSALENVEKVSFISKAETLASEKEKIADYPSLLAALEQGDNPYPDTFVITYTENTGVSSLEYQLNEMEEVYKINCRSDIAENIESLKNGIILVFSWFMVILFAVSIFVIINTVKLALVYRSKEITIMRYVGATKWFISLPFQLEGILIGIVSGIIAYFIQYGMYGYVQNMIMKQIRMVDIIPFSTIRVVMLCGCLAIGVFTGFVGSVISIRKYIKA